MVWIQRETRAHLRHFGFDFGLDRVIAVLAVGRQAVDHFIDPIRDLAEFGLANPRVVPAGEPRRIPDVISRLFGSNGTPFLLQVMWRAPRPFRSRCL